MDNGHTRYRKKKLILSFLATVIQGQSYTLQRRIDLSTNKLACLLLFVYSTLNDIIKKTEFTKQFSSL